MPLTNKLRVDSHLITDQRARNRVGIKPLTTGVRFEARHVPIRGARRTMNVVAFQIKIFGLTILTFTHRRNNLSFRRDVRNQRYLLYAFRIIKPDELEIENALERDDDKAPIHPSGDHLAGNFLGQAILDRHHHGGLLGNHRMKLAKQHSNVNRKACGENNDCQSESNPLRLRLDVLPWSLFRRFDGLERRTTVRTISHLLGYSGAACPTMFSIHLNNLHEILKIRFENFETINSSLGH